MFFGDIQQFDEMYNNIEFINKKTEVILKHIETIARQRKNEDENIDLLSDIVNRLEITPAIEKENQELKERIEELEKENKWLETRLKISMETSDNLIKLLIKGD